MIRRRARPPTATLALKSTGLMAAATTLTKASPLAGLGVAACSRRSTDDGPCSA